MVNAGDTRDSGPAPGRRRIPLLRGLDGSWRPAVAGALAAGVAIAASELVAGLVRGAPSLVTAIGSLVISLQPPGAKDLVVSLFGTNDKVALNVGVVALALVVAAAAGVLAARRRRLGAAIFVTFGLLSGAAALRDPLASQGLAVGNAGVAVVAGLVALLRLVSLADERGARGDPDGSAVSRGPDGSAGDSGPNAAFGDLRSRERARRRFLIASAGTLGGAIVAGGAGRLLADEQHADAIVSSSKIPAALLAVSPLAADQVLATPGLTPLVVPNADFYRIDAALRVPRVDAATWKLEVTGMVAHPLRFTYDEILAMPLYEQYVTIACVSNRIGDHLVGNALWTGVRLKDVLEAAGVQPGATQIVGRSVDGFTVGFPTAWAMAPEREAMIAVGMNREPLPADHGFPARLIVPGLYGYVSATKWLSSIELTTREAVDGYWVPLGWAKDAPILTQSRIDVPTGGATVTPGATDIAGVAWAPDRGITAVEVRVDDGAWQAARISRPISKATWVQWTLPWTATPGRHSLEVRATDGTGEAQTDQRSDPAPDGARGHHRIFVTVG
jgi:DMSO/TMAO reductase YedYZ molybdopterin-dependent catalytic subunit